MVDRSNGFVIGSEGWLRDKFPDKDWHHHRRGQSGETQLCDGTPSDCAEKELRGYR